MADDDLMLRAEVAKTVRLSPRTISRLAKQGAFPQPIRLGLHKLAWKRSDIEAWKETGTWST